MFAAFLFFKRKKMLIHRIIYIGRWRVDFFFATADFEPDSVIECLEDMEAPLSVLQRSWDAVAGDRVNAGFCYSSSRQKRSCIFIGPTTSGSEFLDTFTHELRHLADDIATHLGIDLRGEQVAYITGDTTRDLAEIVCRLGCPTCHD